MSDGSEDGALRAVHDDGARLATTVGNVVAELVKTKFDIAQVPLNFDLLMLSKYNLWHARVSTGDEDEYSLLQKLEDYCGSCENETMIRIAYNMVLSEKYRVAGAASAFAVKTRIACALLGYWQVQRAVPPREVSRVSCDRCIQVEPPPLRHAQRAPSPPGKDGARDGTVA